MNSARGGATAVVVGGGIAGLATAVGLHRSGWQVTVLDRGGAFGEVNAGVALGVDAVRALDALGLGDPVRDAGQVTAIRVARAPAGRGLSRIGATTLASQLGSRTLGVHRATLHRILRQALPNDALRAGTEVVAVRPGGSAQPAEVDLGPAEAPQTVRGDLVVVADGRDSSIRGRLWPRLSRPVPLGTSVWRGLAAHPAHGQADGSISWGGRQAFVTFGLGDGWLSWYASAPTPLAEPTADELAEVRRRFGHWPGEVPGLLAATAGHTVLRDDLSRLPGPLPSLVAGRVALVGEAAHADRPEVGQGVTLALQDALALAAHCSRAADVAQALRGYDRERGSQRHRQPAPHRVTLPAPVRTREPAILVPA